MGAHCPWERVAHQTTMVLNFAAMLITLVAILVDGIGLVVRSGRLESGDRARSGVDVFGATGGCWCHRRAASTTPESNGS